MLKKELSKKHMKQRVIKGVNVIAQLALVFYFSGVGVFLTPNATQAADNPDIGFIGAATVDLNKTPGNPGAIWTTRNDCGEEQQDVNHFSVGENVYINGANFDEDVYNWDISGQPGGASGDPGQEVASGQFNVDSSGSFCFNAYTVQSDDWGEYKVTFGNKHDNYRVEPSLGTLRVIKNVDGGQALPEDFGFRIVGWQDAFEYPDTGENYVEFDLPIGTYSVEETTMPDYQLTDNTCIDVTIEANRMARCTITNTYSEQPEPATIYGRKVVCEAEEYLPDWGVVDGINPDKPDMITGNTAQDWVDQSGGHCWIDDQWAFQWVWASQRTNPDDNQELYDLPWQNFTTVDPLQIDRLTEDQIWLRESPNPNWVPFNSVTGTEEYQESAEFYCGVDILNYDNYEWIGNAQLPLENGGEYHCVGFNAHPEPEYGSLMAYKEVSGGEAVPQDFSFRLANNDAVYIPVNKDGYVMFDNLLPGTYSVEEMGPDNYVGDDGCTDVLVQAGEPTMCTITNTYTPPPTFKINGRKFHDKNADRAMETTGEEWTSEEPEVTITITGDDYYEKTTTDANGFYSFSGVPAGTYTVCEITPEDWLQTYPFGNEGCHEVTVGPEIAISVLDHYEKPMYNFGNYSYGSIAGSKWEDKNINTVWDEEENGKEGWTINLMSSCSQDFGDYDYVEPYGVINLQDFVRFGQLYNERDLDADLSQDGLWGQADVSCFGHVFNGHDLDGEMVVVKSAQTAADGSYSFDGLLPGIYTLGEESRADWYQSAPGNEKGLIEDITITSQGSFVDQNFGNYQIPAEPEPEIPVINITKTDDADPVTAGDQITYTLTWEVTEADVTDLILTDNLPVETSIVSVMDGGIYDSDSHTVTWELGDQSAGASGAVSYIVSVKDDVLDGTVIINTATLDSNETEAKIATENTAVVNSPVLNLLKTVDTSAVLSPGDEVNFTVTVENTGFGTAENVELIDTLPGELFYSDILGTERVLTSGGNLAVGDSMTFTYPVTVKSDTTTGTYTNTATLTADNYGTLTAVASVQVQAEGVVLGDEALPNLTFSKAVDLPFANPGDTVNYTVTVSNNGEAPAANLVLTDTLPTGFTFEETGGTTRTWKLNDLAQGESLSISYAVVLDSTVVAGTYENVAVVTADNHDPLTAKVDLEVRAGSVLGEETTAELEDTGVGILDYLIMIIASLILFGAAGTTIWMRQRSKTRA